LACNVTEKEHKAINHRVVFCDQMVTMEEAFVSHIRKLTAYWGPAISNGRSLTRDQFQALFHNVDPILKAHEFFLDRLKAEPGYFASQFGCIFLNFVQFFKIGTAFVSKFKQMDVMIKDLCKGRSFEAKWLQTERGRPAGTGCDFLSFYVTPVQRYPRCPLLLATSTSEPATSTRTKPFLAAAINAIDFVNKQIDQSSAKENQNQDIITVQNLLEPSVKIMTPGRQIVQ
jgi:hypothetical protein